MDNSFPKTSARNPCDADSASPAFDAADALQALFASAVARHRAGDGSAFDEVHRRLGPALRRHFQAQLNAAAVPGATGDGGDMAADLAQRTWVEFWRCTERGTYDPSRARYTTFLYAIAANIWLRFGRERARCARMRHTELHAHMEWSAQRGSVAAGGTADAAGGSAGDSAVSTAWAEAIERVRGVVEGAGGGAFTAEERMLLRAIGEGASERDIAQRMGVSPSTAHERRRCVLERLRGWLASRGIEFQGTTRAAAPVGGEGSMGAAARTSAEPLPCTNPAIATRGFQ